MIVEGSLTVDDVRDCLDTADYHLDWIRKRVADRRREWQDLYDAGQALLRAKVTEYGVGQEVLSLVAKLITSASRTLAPDLRKALEQIRDCLPRLRVRKTIEQKRGSIDENLAEAERIAARTLARRVPL